MNQGQLQRAVALDELAQKAAVVFGRSQSFVEELQVAQATEDIRALLTPEIMQPVMSLMNSDLGFLTDRNPRVKAIDKHGKPMVPYGVEVVRDCFIESRLRGFHLIGGEWCIISGRFYGAQNGYRRLVLARVTNWDDLYEAPRRLDGGAIVECKASWTLNSKADGIQRKFAIKMDDYSSTDQLVGKAQRKLFKAVWDRISGAPAAQDDDVDELASPGHQALPAPSIPAGPPQSQTTSPVPAPPMTTPVTPKPNGQLCVACGGSGRASSGGVCSPCNGSGKAKPVTAPALVPAEPAPARKGPTLVEEPLGEDEKAEAAAGLAPDLDSLQSHSASTAQALGVFMQEHGISYALFRQWGEDILGLGTDATGPLQWAVLIGFERLPDKFAEFAWQRREAIARQITATP